MNKDFQKEQYNKYVVKEIVVKEKDGAKSMPRPFMFSLLILRYKPSI